MLFHFPLLALKGIDAISFSPVGFKGNRCCFIFPCWLSRESMLFHFPLLVLKGIEKNYGKKHVSSGLVVFFGGCFRVGKAGRTGNVRPFLFSRVPEFETNAYFPGVF